MMDQPWQCPLCKIVLAPSVKEHRCDDNGQGAYVPVTPYQPIITGGLWWCAICQTWVYGAIGHSHPPIVTYTAGTTIVITPPVTWTTVGSRAHSGSAFLSDGQVVS